MKKIKQTYIIGIILNLVFFGYRSISQYINNPIGCIYEPVVGKNPYVLCNSYFDFFLHNYPVAIFLALIFTFGIIKFTKIFIRVLRK